MEIKELILFTSNIDKQKIFYSEVLEFELVQYISGNEISFKVGNSVLKFINNDSATPYHFAINIFSNLEQEALEWLKQRISIIPYGADEIHNFDSWNAKAIYFYDEDKNIVEFISRKNLQINSTENFSVKSLLGISEIGCATESIENIYNQLNSKVGLPVYSGSFEEFCAIGDETGLIICVDKNKKKWFPAMDNAHPSEFEVKVLEQKKYYIAKYTKGKLNILLT